MPAEGTIEISLNWVSRGNASSDDLHMVSDERLVAAAKMGRSGAFDDLYKRHAEKMLCITYRITRNREDAEDAVQECFLNAFLHLKSFDRRSRFSTWLTRIAMNAALRQRAPFIASGLVKTILILVHAGRDFVGEQPALTPKL